MIEGRGIIKNIEDTKKKIERLGGLFKNYYSFTDIIFISKSGSDQTKLSKEFVRLRVCKVNNWPTKDIILTHKRTDWRRNFKIDNVILRKEFDTAKEAASFIKLCFKNRLKKDFEYFRQGWEYHLGNKRIFVEDIENFKPTVEIEAENEKELEDVFKKLDITEKLSDSVPEIMKKVAKLDGSDKSNNF